MLRRSVQVFNRLAVRRSAGVGSDARALHRAAPGVEPRGKRLSLRARLLAGLSLAALLLAAVPGLQAPPLGAQSMVEVNLVSNLDTPTGGKGLTATGSEIYFGAWLIQPCDLGGGPCHRHDRIERWFSPRVKRERCK